MLKVYSPDEHAGADFTGLWICTGGGGLNRGVSSAGGAALVRHAGGRRWPGRIHQIALPHATQPDKAAGQTLGQEDIDEWAVLQDSQC